MKVSDLSDLLEAVETIADTSFRVEEIVNPFTGQPTTDPVLLKAIHDPLVAKRRSGSARVSFYRPGERPIGGTWFEAKTESRPKYRGPPSGRAPSDEEKRVNWPLQNEYLNDRLGKDKVENSKLWDTAKWIDKIHRIAMTPKDAVRAGLATTPPGEFVYSADDTADYNAIESVPIRALDVLRILEEVEEREAAAKLNVDKLLRDAGPRPIRIDLPSVYDRAKANKIMLMLRLGMRTLWSPVKLAIVDHEEMYRLGLTQGARREIAPAVGRQRIIEGLRIAGAIRMGITRSEKGDATGEARHWPARERHNAAVDYLIAEVLLAIADKPLPANDNSCPNAVTSVAA